MTAVDSETNSTIFIILFLSLFFIFHEMTSKLSPKKIYFVDESKCNVWKDFNMKKLNDLNCTEDYVIINFSLF